MPEGAVVLFILGPAVLLLCLVMAHFAGTGAIQRNAAAGIRTRATLASDEAWRAGHSAARKPAAIAVGTTLVASVVVVLIAHTAVVTAVLSVAYLALFVGFIVWLVVAANRAARAADPARF